ncbi:transcription factor bHLH18-like [Rhododendron vialii]|uniref:transcription factor bHLH18-like n=1 Tax=Rhododendron vialii TaxID=182163 RepID=UPI00265F636C|nr:transcription factor bHLH18-like [Rhododendron vialii]
MDSPMPWPSELGMEDPIFTDHFDIMEYFDEELAAALGDDFQNSLSSESNSSSSTLLNNIPNSSSTTNSLCASSTLEALESPNSKHHKPNTWPTNNNNNNNDSTAAASLDQQPSVFSSGCILSFGNSGSTENPKISPGALNSEDEEVVAAGMLLSNKSSQGAKKSGSSNPRPASQTYDHIIAERKRREQLSQLFVALSAIVPGLKKMDKTSVLGEAVKYLKHLQDRVKTLEEQSTRQTIESVVLVKKSQLLVEDEAAVDENFVSGSSEPLPQIEARVCNRSVLLRIHCEKHKGVLAKIFGEMERLNLAIVNTSVARFGGLALDITIIAEMEAELCVTVKDLVRTLRPALQPFM